MGAPKTLHEWVGLISEQEMPVFAQTARHVAGISSGFDTSTAELARVVLMDSAMTARLLRLANSVYYNPAAKRITTVSRAIVMLGFETVRTIALSISMVDTLLRGKRHDRVVNEMACAFHAAVQAKAMAAKRGEPAVEEVFIAALLMHLGAMAFWCFPHGCDERLDALLASGEKAEAAERQVLGFSLTDLTAALNREWHLSDLLGQVLGGFNASEARVQLIDLAYKVSASATALGWDAPQTRQLIGRAVRLMNLTEAEAVEMFHANARQAVHAAMDYGAENAAQLIPLPALFGDDNCLVEMPEEQPNDADFMLRILRELSAMLSEHVDLNALLGMVLEGIFRGVGMDRAVLALLTPDGSRLKAKFILGGDVDKLMDCFSFPVGGNEQNSLAQILNAREPVWFGRASAGRKFTRTPELTRCMGECEFFAFPLSLASKARGLFYADRKISGRPLDDRSYDAFRHLCEQAVIGLSVIGLRG